MSSKREELTKRQMDVFKYIEKHILKHHVSPTVREIGAALKIKSPNGVMCHLKPLVKKGWLIKPGSHLARSLWPVTLKIVRKEAK